MRVLHYSLGFPPYRTGGLTKYCCDLMESQVSRGFDVALVWPGSMRGSFGFKKHSNWRGIANWEMTAPLPVPYDEGIIDPLLFMESRDFSVCEGFLKAFAPDVLHVHTTMGLPLEFVQSAHDLGIRTIFTTHDYYPLCPRVTLFHDGEPCVVDSFCRQCPACNAHGLSLNKIRLLQSPAYRAIKNTAFVKTMRARHRNSVGSGSQPVHDFEPKAKAESYYVLRDRNLRLLGLFDIIHANSTLAAGKYGKHLPGSNIRVVAIGSLETRELRLGKAYRTNTPVRIGYFGAASSAKGYYLLMEALCLLWNEGMRFELHLYGPFECDAPFASVRPRYSYNEIDSVYQDTDLAVVPSLCPETFGFQATEALCRGVPVAVSSMVGMKDILGEEMGVVFEPTVQACAEALRRCLDPAVLSAMRSAIAADFIPPRLESVESLYGEGRSHEV